MKGRSITILCVGKLKNGHWQNLFSHYQKMLGKWRKLNLLELRDSSGNLAIEARIRQEGEKILQNLPAGCLKITLHEEGRLFTSPQFAELLQKWEEKDLVKPCFILGGPFGLSSSVISASDLLLSLSPMTFPHEMARVLLMEQLYRAYAILARLPYHH